MVRARNSWQVSQESLRGSEESWEIDVTCRTFPTSQFHFEIGWQLKTPLRTKNPERSPRESRKMTVGFRINLKKRRDKFQCRIIFVMPHPFSIIIFLYVTLFRIPLLFLPLPLLFLPLLLILPLLRRCRCREGGGGSVWLLNQLLFGMRKIFDWNFLVIFTPSLTPLSSPPYPLVHTLTPSEEEEEGEGWRWWWWRGSRRFFLLKWRKYGFMCTCLIRQRRG